MGRSGEKSRQGIPYSTVLRLASYLRTLEWLSMLGVTTVSSEELARQVGVNSYLVRKDLSYFGEFGVRGFGYPVGDLIAVLREILDLNRDHYAVLVGVGNLGRALVRYYGFAREGFKLSAVFDSSPRKIGTRFNGHQVRPVGELVDYLRSADPPVELGIITVPAMAAQFVGDLMVVGGVKGILNFSPVRLQVPGHIHLLNVDLVSHLEVLSFYIARERPFSLPAGRSTAG